MRWVYVAGRELDLASAEDLVNLPAAAREALHIGVFTPGPAAEWLARRGLYDQMVPHSALDGDPDVYPGKIIENELLAGELDAAILWGPIAGYFAARAAATKVAVVPLRSEPGIQFEFAVAAGVRFGERDTRAQLRRRNRRAVRRIQHHVLVDLATGDVVRTVAVGGEPEGVRLRPDRKTVYVTSESDHAVTVVDTESNYPRISFPAFDASTLNARTGEVLGNIEVGWRPRDSIFSADGSPAYVSVEHGGSVAVVDVASSKVLETIALPPGALPMRLVLSPDEQRLYVANGRARKVSVVDLNAGALVADVRVGARPWGIGLTSDGKFLYTANGPSNDVSVIDTASLKVVATARVGAAPWGLPSARRPENPEPE